MWSEKWWRDNTGHWLVTKRLYEILQSNRSEDGQNYAGKRNASKWVVKKAHAESWEWFIMTIENDINSWQMMVFKLMRHLNKSERDVGNINIIDKICWMEHYLSLIHI